MSNPIQLSIEYIEGLIEGELEGIGEVAKRMLQLGYSLETIRSLTGLSIGKEALARKMSCPLC